MARRRRGYEGSSRTGTVLMLVGIAGVLATTFVAGLWTGRHWPVLTGTAPPGPPRAPAATATRQADAEPTRKVQPLPALTFYDELTAPLTAPPPPPPRPARDRRQAADRAQGSRAEAAPPAPPAGARFTVQVGSYNLKTPAEALRTTLVAAGHEARVVQAETPAGVRYRVQVGTFPTREAAREAAARLGAERSLPGFVTAR